MGEVLPPAPRPLRFGTFELDPLTGELRKAGVLVSLQEQSLRVLLALLERPGELVSREHLHQRVWPDGTFVDFDHGLNAVINRLRDTLGDSAETPRLIETLPRRGYRFIGSIDRQDRVAGSERSGPALDGKASAEGTRRYSRVAWSAVVLTLAIGLAVGLYLYRFRPAPGSAMRTIPLTSLPGVERHPSFSPDGDRVAFVWDGENGDNEDIYVKVIGTERPFRLTTSPAAERYPAWAPDGRHIAFVRASAAGSDLLVIPALGGPERKILARSSSFDFCPYVSWSPDGEFLAIADREENKITCKIFVVSLDTLQKRKLTSPPEGHYGDLAPVYSPDGRTIAFNRNIPGGAGIHVVPAVGGDVKRVTTQQDTWHHRLAWVPPGRELLFSSSEGDPEMDSGLWRVSVSGGMPERLGVGGDNASNPAVSLRGNRLAYEQRRHDANIWNIALAQPSQPALAASQLNPSSRAEFAPHVSPDGRRIVFLSDRSGTDEIWLCDTNGTNLMQLPSSGGLLVGTPRWSPDSRQLAFEGHVKGRTGIFVIDADGGVPREVIPDPATAVLASWSSNGRWIYFGSNRTGRFEVWKVRAEGGRAVQVTKRGGFRAFESADGTFVYYANRFGGGLWRVPVNGGEETAVLDYPSRLWGYWALVNDGIYFVDDKVNPRPALKFFAFGAGRVSHVMSLEGKPIPYWPGLAVSPDGKWLLYVQEDSRSGDIMLVNNFH